MPSAPIRVLHILPWIASGGVERRRLAIARGFDTREYDVSFFCLEIRPEMAADFEAAGARVFVSHAGPFSPRTARALLRALDEVRPQIVHGAVIEGALLAAVFGRLRRVPVVLLEETSDTERRSDRAHTLYRWIARAADGCVAISPHVRHNLIHRTGIPASAVRLILNGAPVPRAVAAEEVHALRARLGLAQDRRLVGTVCRLIPLKRVVDLIDAITEPAWPATYDLVVVGQGPEEPRLRAHARERGVAHRVHFAGYQHDVTPWLAAFEAFAMVSVFEGFGLSIVEAMLSGLPIVAARHGGLRDVVDDGETGLLVRPRAPAEIAEALARLADSPTLRRHLGENARRVARERFTSDAYLARLRRYYDELVSTRGLRGDRSGPEPTPSCRP